MVNTKNTHSSSTRVDNHGNAITRMHPSMKRPRAPIACIRCHHKKVRCDGEHPNCTRCTQGGILCAYPTSRRSRNTQSTSVDPFIDNLSQLEVKIHQIEADLESQKSLFLSLQVNMVHVPSMGTALANATIKPSPLSSSSMSSASPSLLSSQNPSLSSSAYHHRQHHQQQQRQNGKSANLGSTTEMKLKNTEQSEQSALEARRAVAHTRLNREKLRTPVSLPKKRPSQEGNGTRPSTHTNKRLKQNHKKSSSHSSSSSSSASSPLQSSSYTSKASKSSLPSSFTASNAGMIASQASGDLIMNYNADTNSAYHAHHGPLQQYPSSFSQNYLFPSLDPFSYQSLTDWSQSSTSPVANLFAHNQSSSSQPDNQQQPTESDYASMYPAYQGQQNQRNYISQQPSPLTTPDYTDDNSDQLNLYSSSPISDSVTASVINATNTTNTTQHHHTNSNDSTTTLASTGYLSSYPHTPSLIPSTSTSSANSSVYSLNHAPSSYPTPSSSCTTLSQQTAAACHIMDLYNNLTMEDLISFEQNTNATSNSVAMDNSVWYC